MLTNLQANSSLYKCQLGAFKSLGVMLKTADVCASSVIYEQLLGYKLPSESSGVFQMPLHCFYIMIQNHDELLLVSKSAPHLMLL